MTARATSRRRAEAAILRRAAAEAAGRLPGFEAPSVRAILETVATAALRAGATQIPPGGMFDQPEQGRLL